MSKGLGTLQRLALAHLTLLEDKEGATPGCYVGALTIDSATWQRRGELAPHSPALTHSPT